MSAVKVTLAVLLVLVVVLWVGLQTMDSVHARQCIEQATRCR